MRAAQKSILALALCSAFQAGAQDVHGQTGAAQAWREDVNDTVRKAPVRIDPGEKRPADQFRMDVLGRPLTIGGRYELEPRYFRDRDLDPGKPGDTVNVSQDFQLEFYYPWSHSLSAFLQASAFYNPEVYAEDGDPREESYLELDQAWLFASRLFDSDFSFQLGRQRYSEKRQWWWNERLDAIRLYFVRGEILGELSVAEEFSSKRTDLGHTEPLHKDVLRVFGDLVWQWAEKQNLTLFFMSQFDGSGVERDGDLVWHERRDKSDADLTWVGGRAMGKFKLSSGYKFGYWLDGAVVTGHETLVDFDGVNGRMDRAGSRITRNVLGWGLDAGLTWYTKLPLEPYFTVGYAYGSGDSNRGIGTDTGFRQTGIHDNKIKLGGSQRFRYYGELFRPELANLEITTAAIGFPLSEDSAVDLLFHHYRQPHPADSVRDGRIKADPTGISGDLGEEVDLVISLDEWKHFQVQLTGAVFRAGDAYGELSGNTSTMIYAKIKYIF